MKNRKICADGNWILTLLILQDFFGRWSPRVRSSQGMTWQLKRLWDSQSMQADGSDACQNLGRDIGYQDFSSDLSSWYQTDDFFYPEILLEVGCWMTFWRFWSPCLGFEFQGSFLEQLHHVTMNGESLLKLSGQGHQTCLPPLQGAVACWLQEGRQSYIRPFVVWCGRCMSFRVG